MVVCSSPYNKKQCLIKFYSIVTNESLDVVRHNCENNHNHNLILCVKKDLNICDFLQFNFSKMNTFHNLK